MAVRPPLAIRPMSVLELYEDLVAAKKLERDRAQERLLARFVALEQRVAAHRSARRTRPVGWLFGGGDAGRAGQGPLRVTATSAAARPC